MDDFEIAELLHSKLGLAYYVLNGKPAPPVPKLCYEGLADAPDSCRSGLLKKKPLSFDG